MTARRRPDCTDHNWVYCPACEAAARAAWYDELHAGHQVVDGDRLCNDGRPYRRCLTCDAEPDQMAVQRAVAGDPPAVLRPIERRAAVVQLHGRMSASCIAERLGCARRTVERAIRDARLSGDLCA